MKNPFLYIIITLITSTFNAQTNYYTKTGSIGFEASVPSFEEVKTINNTVSSILNTTTGEIAALALVKGFRFKVALMEEHFNESYAESAKFPKATFVGVIDDFSINDLTHEFKVFHLNGKLTFHGKTVDISPEAFISIEENKIYLTSNFILNPKDFDINIPKIVRKKVAKTIEVTIDFELIPKNQ
jgi:YceI-like protein